MAAYYEEGIPHCSINAGNIMTDQPEATDVVLNDCDHTTICAQGARGGHPYRTGTWRFTSVEILKNPTKPHTIHDDVESTFWVLYYTSLHLFKVVSDPPNMYLFNEKTEVIGNDGHVRYYTGGIYKKQTLLYKEIQNVQFASGPLTNAIHRFADILSNYYFYHLTLSRSGYSTSASLDHDALEGIEKVDGIVTSFNLDAIISNEDSWPDCDDAVPHQFSQYVVMDFEFTYHEACPATTTHGVIPAPNHTIASSKRLFDEENLKENDSGQTAKRLKKDSYQAIENMKTGFVSRVMGVVTRKVRKLVEWRKT
ncbi:hypothetical protein BDY19DRAFT_941053 [Irpex rosettiformis]|uniref:Uncharacterized protein n=1 Tax=Irpex rosettiformis TaxID=378272 RepID=A0ACB8U699_9APHY|nr:hypothetical protein BDY19DRAFT_941053 [Irpex rosettiformis]